MSEHASSRYNATTAWKKNEDVDHNGLEKNKGWEEGEPIFFRKFNIKRIHWFYPNAYYHLHKSITLAYIFQNKNHVHDAAVSGIHPLLVGAK